MIRIHFNEPTTDEWHQWRQDCEQKTKSLVKSYEDGNPEKIHSDTYKGKKYGIKEKVFFSSEGIFFGKCAYCEHKISGNQSGDMEHFRPKRKVTDRDNNVVFITQDGEKVPHPGYYWLAYDWKNLLPACNHCNVRQKDIATGQIVGKGTRFPVDGKHTNSPDGDNSESPLLIHPAFEDPKDHLEIDSTGVISWLSERGNTCVEIFGLNGRDLPNDRKTVYDDVVMIMQAVVQYGAADPVSAGKYISKIREHLEGKAPFAMVGRKAIKYCRNNLDVTLASIDTPSNGEEHLA